jgi:hypothetical protein
MAILRDVSLEILKLTNRIKQHKRKTTDLIKGKKRKIERKEKKQSD